MGKRARRLAEERYSIRTVADRYEALYAQLLPGHRQTLPLLMITELFLPTKGGTAVSFDDDFRRLGGKSVHIVTAAVPGDAEFDRDHPNTVHRLRLERSPWLRPESLLMYAPPAVEVAAPGLDQPASPPCSPAGPCRRAWWPWPWVGCAAARS